MAAAIMWYEMNRRALRRNRVFRDRTNPLDVLNDRQVVQKFRFPRAVIFQLSDELRERIEYAMPRKGSLSPVMQVCVALQYYATGAHQGVIGDVFGIDQATVSRTITRVTNALFAQRHFFIRMPAQADADLQKGKFYLMNGFPDVFGCVDGTHIRIQAPSDGNEADYVNRKNFHSINVQVICDADLIFINVIARWPGSVHDARILRTSPLFCDFERNAPPVQGIILGDSAYMLQCWLMTPLLNHITRAERAYNFAHSSTRCTVERSIGVAKQRWRCLRVGLLLEPIKASGVTIVCLMLHNRARRMNLPDPGNDDEEDDDAVPPVLYRPPHNANERARAAAGLGVRRRIIAHNFAAPVWADNEEGEIPASTMDTNSTKGIAIAILFVLTIFFGCLPVWLHYRGSLSATGSRRRKLVLDVFNCFAGGVFLGTCLLHLLVEGKEEFEEYKEQVHFHNDFPFYETLVGIGVFLIALVEKIGFALLSSSKEKGKVEDGGGGGGRKRDSSEARLSSWSSILPRYGAVSLTPGRPRDPSPVVSFTAREAQVHVEQAQAGSGSAQSSSSLAPFSSDGALAHSAQAPTGAESQPSGRTLADSSRPAATSVHSDIANPCQPQGPRRREDARRVNEEEQEGQGPRHDHGHERHQQRHRHDSEAGELGHVPDISQMAAMRGFLLLVALSFHTVFDGLAVGLQDTQHDVWEVLLAIALHKSLATFCLGLQLAAAAPGNARRPAVFMTLFSFISPIGIAIGMAVTSSNVHEPSQLLVSSLLQALATGTFLYVTFFETLGHQFADHHHDADGGDSTKSLGVDLLKVACAVVGFACMALVKLLDKD